MAEAAQATDRQSASPQGTGRQTGGQRTGRQGAGTQDQAAKDQAAEDQAAKGQADKDATKDQDAKDAKPKKFVKPKPPPIPPLVLAYPPDEIARAACALIQLQLRMVGIEVELRQLDGRLARPCARQCSTCSTWNWRPGSRWSMPTGCSAPAAPSAPCGALHGPVPAASSTTRRTGARSASVLRRIHRICYDDVTIIPLWQLLDHFAVHRAGLEGAGGKAVSLYQGVEQWRPTFQYPSEK